MRPRLVVRRLRLTSPRNSPQSLPLRAFSQQSQLTSTKSRPNLPFLFIPNSSNTVRYFTSERSGWLKHEVKLVARYTITIWGVVVCVLVIGFAVNEERIEREFPTPHEWRFLTRKWFRDANQFRDPKNGQVNWSRAIDMAREVVNRLEDPKGDGRDVIKLTHVANPNAEYPVEFVPCDISAKSEEWRRGYFEAAMLVAKAAEHVDGWVLDVTRDLISPPEFVIGPSNPRPTPIPAGNSHAPREENCEIAYPRADDFYWKILGTKGLTPRQRMEAAMEYASFLEYKQLPAFADGLYRRALVEASEGLDESKLPYDEKTFVLKANAGTPSMNLLDAITAIANFKARKGDVAGALPIYLSVLKSRRSLSNEPPRGSSRREPRKTSVFRQVVDFVSPPDYPPPPLDGAQPPWRSPQERCQEASLNLYIGEILYATSSRDEGLAWTRDGVDLAEEQLHNLGPSSADKATKQTCRECLGTGLDNWAVMVAKLAREEQLKREKRAASNVFSFWSPTPETEGRWTAEEGVVKERVRRTRELVEDITPPNAGLMSLFKA